MESVSFTLLAADAISGAGAAALLRPYPTVSLLAVECSAEADVLLVLAGEITAETLDSIERAVRDAANPRMRVVLVGDMVRKQHLLRAVNCGLNSLIPRREASTERLLRAVVGARDGRAGLPAQGAARLLDWVRTVHRPVPWGCLPALCRTRSRPGPRPVRPRQWSPRSRRRKPTRRLSVRCLLNPSVSPVIPRGLFSS
ncbi:hypothetical protein ACWGQL_12960 [Streptomyces lydicus]